MKIYGRAPAGLIVPGAFALGLFLIAGATYAEPVVNEVMLVNAKSDKCATIAGGIVDTNNHPAVQFTCDNDPSRRWRLNETSRGVYQIRNVQTGKCLTIAGGELSDNNRLAVQFTCDSHPSRRWRINDVTGNGFYQLRNVKTGKCLTFSGGTLAQDNLDLLQFDCDSDPSRRWTIRLKL